jgi:hypothetical protein
MPGPVGGGSSNPFASMFSTARSDGSISRAELERIIAFANRGGLKDDETQALLSAANGAFKGGKLSQKGLDFVTGYLGGQGVAANGTGVKKKLDGYLADGKISVDEAKELVSAVKKFGISKEERQRVTAALNDEKYKDAFEDGAAGVLSKAFEVKPKGEKLEGYGETRRLLGTALADGKLEAGELGRLDQLIERDGVSDGEKKALTDALEQNKRRLDQVAKDWFAKYF